MRTWNEDRNRKTKYGHERRGNKTQRDTGRPNMGTRGGKTQDTLRETKSDTTPPSRTHHPTGRGGGRSGGLKGHGDRTGQEASRVTPVPEPMAEREARAAMAEQGARAAMADPGTREVMADRGTSGGHGGTASEAAAPAPTPASSAGALLPLQKKNSLGKIGAQSGTWGRSGSAGTWGRSGSAGSWGRCRGAGTGGRCRGAGPGGSWHWAWAGLPYSLPAGLGKLRMAAISSRTAGLRGPLTALEGAANGGRWGRAADGGVNFPSTSTPICFENTLFFFRFAMLAV